MNIAFLSDVHSNLPALRSALATAGERGADRIVVCGDIVGAGPFPDETVDLLRAQPSILSLRGNVDRKVLKEADRKRKKLRERVEKGKGKKLNLAWTALNLGEDNLGWLRSLPHYLSFREGDTDILAVHGSPLGDTDYLYSSITEDALTAKLEGHTGPRPRLLVAGHSHIPFTKTLDDILIGNCGSVGLPADGDPRGSLLMIRIVEDQPVPDAEIIRFHYPVEEVEAAILDRDVPGVDGGQYRRGIKLS